MAKHVDMNGLWSGSYSYDLISRPVRFTAWIDDQNGTLGGTITEPNTHARGGPDELLAVIEGMRTGHMIDFTKTYASDSGAHTQSIYYEGEANPALTEVTGIWQFRAPDVLKGQFFMSRISDTFEKAETPVTFATVDR